MPFIAFTAGNHDGAKHAVLIRLLVNYKASGKRLRTFIGDDVAEELEFLVRGVCHCCFAHVYFHLLLVSVWRHSAFKQPNNARQASHSEAAFTASFNQA